MTTMEKARQYAAQAWCDPETSGKVMDPALAEAFAQRLAVLIDLGDELADLAVWMSGSDDFSASGPAGVAWAKRRETLARAVRFLADPASPKAREASFSPSPPAPAEGEREAATVVRMLEALMRDTDRGGPMADQAVYMSLEAIIDHARAAAAPRPTSSPDPARCGCGHRWDKHDEKGCMAEDPARLDPPCPCLAPAPSPDPGARRWCSDPDCRRLLPEKWFNGLCAICSGWHYSTPQYREAARAPVKDEAPAPSPAAVEGNSKLAANSVSGPAAVEAPRREELPLAGEWGQCGTCGRGHLPPGDTDCGDHGATT